MTAGLRRRTLLQTGTGFALAFLLLRPGQARAALSPRPQPGDAAAAAADGHPAFAPNAVIRIDRTGPVRLVMPNVEMGQGIYTGEAALIAEELDVGLDQVVLEAAPPDSALYATPLARAQVTGGSSSIRSNWLILREAGAVGRAMLVEAAAQQWNVDPASCTTEHGVVRHAASGRSATYGDLAQAAAGQPVPATVTLKNPKDFRLIGKPMRRLDTPNKVDGVTQFGMDVRVPDMQIAAVSICPIIGGRLRRVNDSAARAVPGVSQVVRLQNAVAVIGVHYWAARTGVDALEVEWEPGPDATFSTGRMFADMAHTSQTGTPIVARQVGDLNQSGKRIEAVYQLPLLAHATMEPLNAVVHVRPDACEIWTGTQVPVRAVTVATQITGLPAEKVILHNQFLGGGFGRRLEIDAVALAVRIARQVPHPVKLILTREQDIRHDIPRPAYYDRIAATVNSDGFPVAWTDRTTAASVARRWAPAVLRANGLDPDTTEGADDPPYHLPNLRVEWVPYELPPALPVGWWRGVGETHNLFTVEGFIDELAHDAGKDPVAYRQVLLHDNKRVSGVLHLAAEKFGWGAPRGARIGHGVAVGSPFGSHICAMVEIEVTPRGEIRLRRAVAAVDCGVVINPNAVEAQIQGGLVFGWTAALYDQLTYQDGRAQQGNFNDYRMMRIDETPPIEVHIVSSQEHPGGMGEVGTAIAAPALTNAVFSATGVRLRSLPFDHSLLVENPKVTNAQVTWREQAGTALAMAATLRNAATPVVRALDLPVPDLRPPELQMPVLQMPVLQMPVLQMPVLQMKDERR